MNPGLIAIPAASEERIRGATSPPVFTVRVADR